MSSYRPSCIYLESACAGDEVARRLLEHFSGTPVREVRGAVREWGFAPRSGSLLLTRKRGRFLRPCPATRRYLCCGYHILDFAAGCYLGCSYCILQAYLDFPGLVVYTDWERMWGRLQAQLERTRGRFLRLGTGEFTDSLLLDEITGFSAFLIPRLLKYENLVLELKTKTTNIAGLEGVEHRGRVIVSWSLNSERMIEQEEINAPGLSERLEAARRCRQWGYRLGFHFDPLLYYDGWERDYRRVVSELFARIGPDEIAWISLGCLRFMPDLAEIIRRNHPQSAIAWQEFVRGEDGKMRYFKALRIRMYQVLLEAIRCYAPGVLVYLCMESAAVWREVFGCSLRNNEQLGAMLDECARCWRG